MRASGRRLAAMLWGERRDSPEAPSPPSLQALARVDVVLDFDLPRELFASRVAQAGRAGAFRGAIRRAPERYGPGPGIPS